MKPLPFDLADLTSLLREHPTPFYIYHEEGIRAQIRRMLQAFSWNEGFREYFAVKALPNPEILKIMKEEGCGLDCSSLPELLLADMAGVSGSDIMFSSNDTPAEEFVAAKERGAYINLDDIGHLDFLEDRAGLPDIICFRYNPGSVQSGNAIIGDPKEAKFGLTRDQMFEAYEAAKAKGIKRFGLHTMPISNELNVGYFLEAAERVFALVKELEEQVGITFEFVNLGGGLGIPYKPGQKELDIAALGSGIKAVYEKTFEGRTTPIKIFLESGRYITGPFGFLVSTVRHVKDSYKQYVGLDATMANLMRPGMYGAYHHITVLGKEYEPLGMIYDVVGSLCENNDKFAIDRQLPPIEPGDIVALHDAGAHGHAMGFNYNGKLRCAEFLMGPDKSLRMIRRAETTDDLFSTLRV